MAQKIKEHFKNNAYVKRASKLVPSTTLSNRTTDYTTKDGDNSNDSEDTDTIKCK